MQPTELDHSWYQFEPHSRFFEITDAEIYRITEYLAPPSEVGHDARLLVRSEIRSQMQFWLRTRHNQYQGYKDMGALKTDFESALNDTIAEKFAAYNLTPLPRKDTFGTVVRVTADAMTTFYPNWRDFYDVYVDRDDGAVNDSHLKLFVSTPYYHGPGVYKFLCRNRRLISMPIARAPEAEKLYCHLVAKHSNKCLAVANASVDWSAPLVQQEKARQDHALWRLEPFAVGSLQLVVKHSNLSINMPWGSSDDGVQVVQYNYQPSSAGQVNNDTFSLVPAGDNFFHIVFKKSGKCLAVKDASVEDGAAVVQMPISYADNALWRLEFL